MNYYIINGQIYSTDELYHYGVKGMKWGVRKATFYSETTNKIGGEYTDQQKKRIKRQAESILSEQIARDNALYNAYTKNADKHYKKLDKLVYKSEARQSKGDQAGFQKYQSKAWKQTAKHLISKGKADEAIKRSKLAQTRLSEIREDKLKAGRDYVTNTRSSTNLLLSAMSILNWKTERRVDFKED